MGLDCDNDLRERESCRSANMEADQPRLFRVSVELTPNRPILLPPFLGPAIYATLSEAWMRATGTPPQLPANMWVEASGPWNANVKRREPLQFVISTLQKSSSSANELLQLLYTGIRSVGACGLNRSLLGGNFELTKLANLATGLTLANDETVLGVSLHELCENMDRDGHCQNVRIQIESPLRLQRKSLDIVPGHRYLDSGFFPIDRFVTSISQRLMHLGVIRSIDRKTRLQYPSLTVKKLRWREVRYGHKNNRKSFGGVTGVLCAEMVSAEVYRLMSLGQYFGVGELTRFGFGRYTIVGQLPSFKLTGTVKSVLHPNLKHQTPAPHTRLSPVPRNPDQVSHGINANGTLR